MKHVFAALHVTADRRYDFVLSHVFRYHAARYLPFRVDPFDDPAAAAPGLRDGR